VTAVRVAHEKLRSYVPGDDVVILIVIKTEGTTCWPEISAPNLKTVVASLSHQASRTASSAYSSLVLMFTHVYIHVHV
jgi:hypothetical protein